MIDLPVGTLPVDFAIWRENQRSEIKVFKIFQATIMNSSTDEVKEKQIAFLQGNFSNVRFSENYCFAFHEGDAESLCDFTLKYLSVNSTAFIQTETIDLVTVFDAILTSRQTHEKLKCLYENLMSNNFGKAAVLKNI